MKHALLILMAAASSLAAPAAWAEDPPAPDNQTTAAFDAAVPDSELANYRGGATITNTNDLGGSLYDNNALNTVTGSNFVTDGALAGSSGFATLIQNSGNNVLIQNAMILNLQVQ